MRLLYILFFFVFISCENNITMERKDVLWNMVKSDNVDSIIEATIKIQEEKDTSMVNALLYNANDPRITNRMSQKGMSVYQIKMKALKSITGINPPNEITYKVDTAIIRFYKSLYN